MTQPGEQIGLDFSVSASESAPAVKEEIHYEALDYQLADLFLALDKEQSKTQNQILKKCTLEISKQTREGCIAIACTPEQQKQLLASKVVAIAEDDNDNYKPLILDNGKLFLRRYWQYQKLLADQIQTRMHQQALSITEESWIDKRLDYYFKSDSQEGETNWQQLAAKQALKNKFLIISGGPGTGKTTTITRILVLLIEEYIAKKSKEANEANELDNKKSVKKGGDGYKKHSFDILLAAPTGKASIRMLDSIRDAQQKMQKMQKMELTEQIQHYIPKQASTIHKLLGYIPDSISFKHNRNNPLKADIVLIDEASMIDIALMSKLIEAVPAHAKLILIGDKDQLSSVETGSVFADICQGLEDTPYLVTLQKNWRFVKDSGIGQLAIATNKGDHKTVLAVLNDQDQPSCELLSASILSNQMVAKQLISPWEAYFEVIKNPQATLPEIFEAFNQYRILCALRRGLNGSLILSDRIEKTLIKQNFISVQTRQQSSQQATAKWYHGRPVMITQNSYEKGLFNGDTGIALIKNGQLKVYFPDKEEGDYKSLTPIRLPAHETTWAMTIHKSQGSEFNQVTLILPHEVMPLLTRQLIYTGITRAKQKVTIVASKEVLLAGVKSEAISATRISEMLNDNN